MEVMFDYFEQLNGTDILESNARVKKFNRSSAVLDGTFNLKIPMDDSFKIKMDFYHSPKGNQQFNYYPLKLPLTGVCAYIKSAWKEYMSHLQSMIDNLPEVDECPFSPREVRFTNLLYPQETVPEFAPTGLWKIYLTIQSDTGEGLCLLVLVKLYNGEFFG
ncbi:uncharacterized protein LOC131695297 [Topomyia yanbarensis]|uniref:uncharacterized protein LOC131686990 n=1 Tax=Topomyia yanbarensis TaxID=2498891 RepID=UPI00273C96EC|nr:uncharacterized protein LOC131686990 [Topomyia yanbarensis]XP_058839749.1 uncharacterized protein LOC131695297 [Topomyia yanbarensis]